MRSLAAGWEAAYTIDGSGSLWAGGCNRENCLFEEEGEEPQSFARLDLAELEGVPFEAVQAGRDHALAILEGGRAVISWGPSNDFGQLGHGPAQPSRVRPAVVLLSGITVKQVACGEFHSLVLTVQGEVFAFGSNTYGSLGTNRREHLHHAEKISANHLRGMPVRGIAAGAQSSMALSIGGQVFCWGCNGHGRLGLGPSLDHEEAVLAPVVVPGLPGMARAIAAGGRHSAVLLRRGRLFLTGDNRCGQLGQPRTELQFTSTFCELPFHPFALRVRTVALGGAHTHILSYDGELYACGSDAAGQLGIGSCAPQDTRGAPAGVDVPTKVHLRPEDSDRDHVVVGIAACHNHTVVLALSVPAASGRVLSTGAHTGRPQTSMVLRAPRSSRPGWGDFAQTEQGNGLNDLLSTIKSGGGEELDSDPFWPPVQELEAARPSTGVPRSSLAQSLTSGCTSRLGYECDRSVVVQYSIGGHRLRQRVDSLYEDEPSHHEEVVLLQPVVQAGVAGSVGFAGLSVAKLASILQAATPPEGCSDAAEELQNALGAALATPSLLNASFCFPGLYRPRLDAGGLLNAFKDSPRGEELVRRVELQLINAAYEGLGVWAGDHDEAASLVHRDQLRGLPALLLLPILSNPTQPQHYDLMSKVMRLVAWMPPDGRRELQEVIVEDCSQEDVLRSLVRRVRDHCDETVRRAHQMQRLSPEIWEGLMLLQLLWGANGAIAQRLDQDLRTQPAMPEEAVSQLGLSLTQALSQLGATGKSSNPAASMRECFGMAAQHVQPPVPAAEFHLQSLAEELVPPELEFRLFIENACAGPITPKEVLELPLYAARTDYGFEYVLPSKMRSFMANRNLVPVSFTRKVLQIENHHAQVHLQHQVARRVAADLEVLPGHEIHIDPALLFFILKVRRERILEDTAAALQRATPEDLRRQLKVIFEGEQGVDEGGLAREFFRLLSQRVFTTDCGLFDPAVAQSARVLWFDKASSCESTDFWLAGVILGLVVYNNMPGLNVRFPSVVFKRIKAEPLSLEDLRQVYPDTFLSLRSLLQWKPEDGIDPAEANNVFENTFCLDFTVSFDVAGKTETRELCDSGRDRSVTLDNRDEFVSLYVEWLLTTSIDRQFEPFRKGVRRVCDSPLFNALDSAELELIVCGEQQLDFTQMRSHAHYDGFEEDSGYIETFWKLLLTFDSVQKKKFLSFVTGSDLAPVGGLQELQLVVQKNGAEPTERLPTAHTCFNLLLLPEYETYEKLERMMVTAMHNAEGFGLE